VPAIKAIREAHPKAYIALVTSSRAKTLVELCPYIDKLFDVEMDDISNALNPFNGEKLTNVWRLVSELRSRRFDVIADFTRIGSRFNAVKRAVLFNLIQGKRIVGRNTLDRGFYLDGKVYDSVTPDKHEVDYCLEIVSLLGANLANPKLEIFIKEKDNAFVDQLLSENGIQHKELVVGINPGRSRPYGRWLKERFATVANNVISDYSAKIAFVGGKSDVPFVEEVYSLMKFRAVNLAGKTSLRQLAALLKRLDLFITNDSGPMHIAAAVNTPIIALFGPGSVTKYQPYCDKKVIIRKDLECSPCYEKADCKEHTCMNLISVEDVMEAVKKLLTEGKNESMAI